MDLIPFHKPSNPVRGQLPMERIDASIDIHPVELNITDGGEFLDDAIRMKDQPLRENHRENAFNLSRDVVFPT